MRGSCRDRPGCSSKTKDSSHDLWAEENSVAGNEFVQENPTYDQGGECQRATTFHPSPPMPLISMLPESLGTLGISSAP